MALVGANALACGKFCGWHMSVFEILRLTAQDDRHRQAETPDDCIVTGLLKNQKVS